MIKISADGNDLSVLAAKFGSNTVSYQDGTVSLVLGGQTIDLKNTELTLNSDVSLGNLSGHLDGSLAGGNLTLKVKLEK